MDKLLPRLPFAEWIDNGVDWLVVTFGTVFDGISDFLKGIVEGSVEWLDMVPSILLAVLFALLAWFISTRRIALFTLIGLLVHRLLRLLVPDAANAGACTHICILCARDWNSNRHLGFTTSDSQGKLSIHYWI